MHTATPTAFPKSRLRTFLFPVSLGRYVAMSLLSKMSTFPTQLPAITPFNLFYPRPRTQHSALFTSSFTSHPSP
jgi:hypothetical protein